MSPAFQILGVGIYVICSLRKYLTIESELITMRWVWDKEQI